MKEWDKATKIPRSFSAYKKSQLWFIKKIVQYVVHVQAHALASLFGFQSPPYLFCFSQFIFTIIYSLTYWHIFLSLLKKKSTVSSTIDHSLVGHAQYVMSVILHYFIVWPKNLSYIHKGHSMFAAFLFKIQFLL